ncbi:NADH-cytochrome b5 reductase 2 [Wickerhamomyces ciferrii]|uniref:NADH-cytochrome b5 reductase n=1 Tax=Wickerhamomyces ciferrii (strain ATCC 14091 / BCRC 22168 / CBS 111 / JCM 3599 / NBRC 0793 / NRRL Y-1031 F-60-10) TaxID=1206466 RepID=K0KD78_WICCF|nr:NADH-cytochrome b5 reductase 2 [Wickerhamomyces ciferrii]CCH40851.1 NADH-cytochrome b5 reductase 2 [Wickerhamomyces ciferrii]
MSSIFSRFASSRTQWVPFAVGGAAVAASLYYSTTARAPVANETPAAFKGDNEWVDLKVNTRHFYFALPSADQVSGLKTASMLLGKYVTEKGNNVIRPYTPISDNDQKGQIEFVIKRYPTGKFGNHLFSLKENDTVTFKGPVRKWEWTPNQFENVTLIGGGSGITPLWQILHEITKNPEEKTKVNLVYGNKTPEDILLKKDLDAIAEKFSDRVKVHYFVDKPVDGWKGETGFITKDWLSKNVPHPDNSHQVFVCGPPPLYEAISGNKVSPSDQGELTGALKELGFTKDNVFKF